MTESVRQASLVDANTRHRALLLTTSHTTINTCYTYTITFGTHPTTSLLLYSFSTSFKLPSFANNTCTFEHWYMPFRDLFQFGHPPLTPAQRQQTRRNTVPSYRPRPTYRARTLQSRRRIYFRSRHKPRLYSRPSKPLTPAERRRVARMRLDRLGRAQRRTDANVRLRAQAAVTGSWRDKFRYRWHRIFSGRV
jgi:hypothetical protein